MNEAWTPSEDVRTCHRKTAETIATARRLLDRPLRLVDKILAGHMPASELSSLDVPGSILALTPDRLAMPDSSAQMALLQFMSTGLERVALPTTVHCDHLIRAQSGAAHDLAVSNAENLEVYEFLQSACARFGIGLWNPGSGIIHQVILERYAYPGGFLLGADSHTPNAGGLGMLAIGVGGAQAVDVMVGRPFEIPRQRVIGIELTGRLTGFASAKDVILRVAQELTVSGGTGAIIEYFGEGVRSLSATGRATICNMGAELGATTSIFPADERSVQYLRATGRPDIAELVAAAGWLAPDEEVAAAPVEHYDEYLRIHLSDLSPQVVGPHSPDRGRSLSAFAQEISEEDWPDPPAQALIGSCTNSSYEDIGRAASIARQAAKAGLKVQIPLLVTPGSEAVRLTVERDGLLADLEAIGATVLANACGPCIGQWTRTDVSGQDRNSIITSFNRNFPGRNDGSSETLAFIASPEVVVAIAIAGSLGFDPARDSLSGPDGQLVRFVAPDAMDLPPEGISTEAVGFVAPPSDAEEARTIQIAIDPNSERLQALAAFPPWTDDSYGELPILIKVDGKCTTDHISPAGPWLRFRGHLDRISNNMFLGAKNAFIDSTGHGIDQIDNTTGPLHEIARHYKSEGINWVVVGDDNYGEGSSREHAAMEPRYLGCLAVIAKSYARIHEANLKKHGVLPLWFLDGADYDRLEAGDRLTVRGLASLQPGREVEVDVCNSSGESWTLRCTHTLSEEQIAWFHAGSALNFLVRGRHSLA